MVDYSNPLDRKTFLKFAVYNLRQAVITAIKNTGIEKNRR